MKFIKKAGLFSLYILIVLTTLFGAMATEIPVVQLGDTTDISYLNIFNYNTSIHNNLTGIQGGLPNEYYHLNYAEYILVTTFLGNASFDLSQFDLQEGYIYVGNESNNPEGISSSDFISGFNIGNFTGWDKDYNDLINTPTKFGNTTYEIFNAVNNDSFAPVGYGDEWNKTYADTLYTNETDTDTNLTDADILAFGYNHTTTLTAYYNTLYATLGYGDEWNKTYADTLYTNETDTDTNCSIAGSCSAIVYNTNTSWITDNQNYNTTDEMFNAANNDTFLKTAVESLSSADDYISVDSPTGIVEINFNESKLEVTYYNATSVLVITGTGAGTLSDIQAYDVITYNVTEDASDYELRVNFTGIDDFTTLLVRHKSSINDGHIASIQIWDYNSSAWEGYGHLTESTTSSIKTLGVYDASDHIEDGIVQVRFYQDESPPPTTHIHQFDWVALSKGFGTPVGQEIDPLSWHLTDFDILDYITIASVLGYNYYNASNFSISDYVTLTKLLSYNYYNESDFVIADYSTTTQANLLYAPVGYGDEWNKTYADTLYTNETDTDTNLTEADITAFGFTKDIDTDTNLTEADITAFGFTKDIDTDTNLTDADILAFGYNHTTTLTAYYNTLYSAFNYNPFDQVLNTTSNVQFNNVTIDESIDWGNDIEEYANATCKVIRAGTTYFEVCK